MRACREDSHVHMQCIRYTNQSVLNFLSIAHIPNPCDPTAQSLVSTMLYNFLHTETLEFKDFCHSNWQSLSSKVNHQSSSSSSASSSAFFRCFSFSSNTSVFHSSTLKMAVVGSFFHRIR